MLLPSRLLTLPKVSENLEISINSPKTIKMEPDTIMLDTPTVTGQWPDEPAAGHPTLSSTPSSQSDRLDTTEAETEAPGSLTPESSMENEDVSSHKEILSLSGLWTEQSEKAR